MRGQQAAGERCSPLPVLQRWSSAAAAATKLAQRVWQAGQAWQVLLLQLHSWHARRPCSRCMRRWDSRLKRGQPGSSRWTLPRSSQPQSHGSACFCLCNTPFARACTHTHTNTHTHKQHADLSSTHTPTTRTLTSQHFETPTTHTLTCPALTHRQRTH